MLTSLAEACDRGAQVVHVNPLVEAASAAHDRAARLPRDGDLPDDRGPARSTSSRGSAATSRCCAASPRRCSRRPRPTRTRSTARSSTSTRPGFEDYRRCCADDAVGRARAPVRRGRGDDPRGGASVYVARRAHDRQLVPRPDPAGARRRHDPRDRQPAAAARQHRPRGRRARRPIRGHSQRPGQPHLRHRPPPERASSSTGWPRSAGSTRRASTGSTPCGTIEAMHRGDVKVFVGMGGNFALAAPDTALHVRGAPQLRADGAGQHEAQPQPPRARPAGADPALPRPHREGPCSAAACRATTVEDAMSMVHLSRRDEGARRRRTCARSRRSSPGMAQATLPDSKTPWQDYVDDYDRIRDTMAQGARRASRTSTAGAPAARLPDPRSRRASCVFLTPSGPRRVLAPRRCPTSVPPDGTLILGTMRSHDQWNTTIYSERRPLPRRQEPAHARVHERADMQERGLAEFDLVDITSIARDGCTPLGLRLPRARLRHPARQRRRLHARAERARARSATTARRATSR